MTDLLAQLQDNFGDAYQLERELGGGGMSRVFLATDARLGRRVVIKVLPAELAAFVGRDRFEREIRMAASLQHPHLVPLLSAGAAGELLYYVMPFIEGESLAARVAREGALPVGDAIRILRDVADALAYAHSRGVVHRDIKPDNLLLSERHALVTDFGVAKAVTASAGHDPQPRTALTETGMALGTPAYMAPEQASADPNVDHRADIYSLGAVGYELLAGRTPFVTGTPQAMLAAHVTAVPDPVNQHRPAIPAELAAVVMRCLEKHPADRWQAAAELLGRLDALATPSGGSTAAVTMPAAAVRASAESVARRSHPARVGPLCLAATAAVTGLAYLATRALGLPDWVWILALGFMLAGLPVMLYTGLLERRRAQARATGAFRFEPEAPHQRLFTWRRALTGGALALGALLLLTAGYAGSRALGVGPGRTLISSGALADDDRLVLGDFSARGVDDDIAITVTEALRVDLGQSRTVKLLDPRQVSAALGRMGRPGETVLDEAVAREVAQREGAKGVLIGEIAALPQGYVITARVVRADSGTTLVPVRVTAATDGELIAAVNKLSSELRERIGESLGEIRASEPLAQVTTASLPALQLYSRARRFFEQGDFTQSRDLLLRAVQIDSTFATAWRSLSAVYFNLGNRGKPRRDALDAAFRHRERLPPLERHLTVAGYYQFADREPDSAIAAFQAALDIAPDNPTATNNLGLLYNAQGRFAEAEQVLRRGIASPNRVMSMVVNLAFAYLAQGKWAESDSLNAFAQEHFPEHPYTLGHRVDIALAKRDLAAAERLFAEPRLANMPKSALEAGMFQRALIAEMRGQLRRVEAIADSAGRLAIEAGVPGRAASWALVRAAHEARQRANPAAARAVLARALASPALRDLPQDEWPHGSLGEIYALLGDVEGVRKHRRLDDASTPADSRMPDYDAWWDALEAEATGRWADAAAAHARGAESVRSCMPCLTFYTAHALDRAGQADSAEAWYRAGVESPATGEDPEDATFYPVALRRLAEFAESRGDRGAALGYYERFVDLWRDADPELQPQVAGARQRIAALTAEPRPQAP